MTFVLLPPEIVESLADDAETLALIHSSELSPSMLTELRSIGFPDNLGLLPAGPSAAEAWTAMRCALDLLKADADATEFDRLAADYASIYLTSGYGVSPCESTWFDDDHLICQDAMFQLREVYRAAGLVPPTGVAGPTTISSCSWPISLMLCETRKPSGTGVASPRSWMNTCCAGCPSSRRALRTGAIRRSMPDWRSSRPPGARSSAT
jgi:hypothetical protein